MQFEVVSHWRTGTNLLRYLLFYNFETKAEYHNAFAVNHLPPWRYGPTAIGMLRDIAPTLFSLWRVRVRQGVHPSTDFTTFLHTPYNQMRRARVAPTNILVDGRTDGHINKRAINELWMTPGQYWLYCSKHVVRCSICHFRYEELVHDPIRVIETIATATGVPCKPDFTPAQVKVGVWAREEEPITCTERDFWLMHSYQQRFDDWYREHRNDTTYPYGLRHYKWAIRRWKKVAPPRLKKLWRRRRLRRLEVCRRYARKLARIAVVN